MFISFAYDQTFKRDIIGIKFVLATDFVECFSRPNIFPTSLECQFEQFGSQKLEFGKQFNVSEN